MIVSIHSRLFKPGELRVGPIASYCYRFQSTPDYLNRENFDDVVDFPSCELFQSTPDYLNRENDNNVTVAAHLAHVSIHSRLFKPGE